MRVVLYRRTQTGSWEGGSASWLAQNLLQHPASLLVCLDSWDVAHRADYAGFNIADVEVRRADVVLRVPIQPILEAQGAQGSQRGRPVLRNPSCLSRKIAVAPSHPGKRSLFGAEAVSYRAAVRSFHPLQGRCKQKKASPRYEGCKFDSESQKYLLMIVL